MKWAESGCGFCPDPGPFKADKAIIVTFRSDATFSVEEDSRIISEGTWEVLENEFGFFISLDPRRNSYLDGDIGICDRQIISDGRAWDGNANLFSRVD